LNSIGVLDGVVIIAGKHLGGLLISPREVNDGVLIIYSQRCASDISVNTFVIVAQTTELSRNLFTRHALHIAITIDSVAPVIPQVDVLEILAWASRFAICVIVFTA
jgi:hypothetical protein